MTNDQNKTASPPKPKDGYDVYDGGPPKPPKGLFQRLLDYYHGSGWQDQHIGQAIILLTICAVGGIVFILFFALQTPYQMTLYSNTSNATIPTPVPTFTFWDSALTVISVFGSGVIIAGASYFLGGFLGFLFGIPKAVKTQQIGGGSTPGGNSEQKETEGHYKGNTNLEDISDWLTKIIIGVGLIELTQIPSILNQYSQMIAPALGGIPSSGAFGIAILFCYSIIGFLTMYLATIGYMESELEKREGEELFLEKLRSLKEKENVDQWENKSLALEFQTKIKGHELDLLKLEKEIKDFKQQEPTEENKPNNKGEVVKNKND